jgi:hypothetical protein
MAVAAMAFCLLRALIHDWFAGVEAKDESPQRPIHFLSLQSVKIFDRQGGIDRGRAVFRYNII